MHLLIQRRMHVLLLSVSLLLITLADAFTVTPTYILRRVHALSTSGSSLTDRTSSRNSNSNSNSNSSRIFDDGTYQSIQDIMSSSFDFFTSMVDTTDTTCTDNRKHRFYYQCFPPSGERRHHHMPIRDLAAAWDATKAIAFFNDNDDDDDDDTLGCDPQRRHVLRQAIHGTLQAYTYNYITIVGRSPGGVALDPKVLQEPANIAHSALLIMAAIGELKLSLLQDDRHPENHTSIIDLDINGLVRGILSMQRTDGAFYTEYGTTNGEDGIYYGIDFFPGEAMLALMDVYEFSEQRESLLEVSTRQAILPSMERAYMFYCDYYHEGGDAVNVNYNIWQIQACARFFDVLHRRRSSVGTRSDDQARLMAGHILHMSQDIVESSAWKYQLSRGKSFYRNINTIEIACGLDALADGIRIALAVGVTTEEEQQVLALFQRNARNAVDFFEWAQQLVPHDSPAGQGGFGIGGSLVLEQRLDVTGHVMSALSKLYRIEQSKRRQ